jgi:hypothetical protein
MVSLSSEVQETAIILLIMRQYALDMVYCIATPSLFYFKNDRNFLVDTLRSSEKNDVLFRT